MKIMVLGAGLVGRPMAMDLAAHPGFQVTVADQDDQALASLASFDHIQVSKEDLSDPGRVRSLVADADLVLDAVPGYLGFQTFRTVIEAGKNIVDIAFFPEDPFELDALAREKGVTAVMDMGVAPGMSNLLASFAAKQMDEVDRVAIYVGGLPCERTWPYEYKAVFSPVDVLEEYTRPARFIRNGQIMTMPALSEPEFIDFPGLGTLEAVNTDGLRSLLYTIKAPEVVEKTLRYPGHYDLIRKLIHTGFLSQEMMEVAGSRIRPIDLTSRLLFQSWKLKKGERDLTVMKIMVSGGKDGKKMKISYDLLDYHDASSNVHSMARTTGYTATSVVRLIAAGKFNRKGVIVPEYLSDDESLVNQLLRDLADRGVVYHKSIWLE